MGTLEKINHLQKIHQLILIEVKNGKAYFVIDHWKYLDARKEAKKKLLGPIKLEDRVYYITQKVKLSRGQE